MDIPLQFPPNKVHPMGWFGPDEVAAREAYSVPKNVDPEALIRVLLSVGADMTMHEPAHFIASAMHNAGRPAWIYRFTYVSQSTRPTARAQVHAGELPFLFDTLVARYGDAVADEDRAIASAFNAYIANFVRTGDPNAPGLPRWGPVVPGEYDLLDFTLDDGPVHGPDPRTTVPFVARARERHRVDATGSAAD
jgi:para-nitrobenzyl esterase